MTTGHSRAITNSMQINRCFFLCIENARIAFLQTILEYHKRVFNFAYSMALELNPSMDQQKANYIASAYREVEKRIARVKRPECI